MRLEDLAQAIAEAVTAVPGVARLSSGSGVEVATLFPGGKVIGLSLSGDVVDVHVVADQVPLPPIAQETAAAARRVLSAAGDEREVRVVIEDVEAAAVDRRAAADRSVAPDRRTRA